MNAETIILITLLNFFVFRLINGPTSSASGFARIILIFVRKRCKLLWTAYVVNFFRNKKEC